MKKLIPLLPLLLLMGCGSFEKQHYKAVKFFNENETLASEYCSGKFPSQTEYIRGEEIIKIDTTFIDVPIEVDCPDGTKVSVDKKVPCEQKTIRITDTLKTPDLARERVLNDKINNCNADNVLLKKENDQLKQKIKDKNTALYMIGALLGLTFYLLIKRR